MSGNSNVMLLKIGGKEAKKRYVPLVKYWGTISSQMDVKSQNASSSDINKSKTAAMIF